MVELLGFDGMASPLACSIHRAVWGDSGEVFVLECGQRRSIDGFEFYRAREQLRLTEMRLVQTFEQPYETVLIAPEEFLEFDGIGLDRRDLSHHNETPSVHYVLGERAALRGIVEDWGSSLVAQMRVLWRENKLTTQEWLRCVRRLQSIASVSEREDYRCAELAFLSLLMKRDAHLKKAFRWDLDFHFRLHPERRAAVDAAVKSIQGSEEKQS